MISAERAKDIADLYYDDVYHLCYLRLKREEEAADVAQEVFLFFQENYDELEDDFIRAWLYKVADNKIKEEFRSIAKREKELIYGSVFGTMTSTDILYEMEEDNKITDEELDKPTNEMDTHLIDLCLNALVAYRAYMSERENKT